MVYIRHLTPWLLISSISVINAAKSYNYKTNLTDDQLYQSTFTDEHLEYLKQETKNLFYYGWDNYMKYGYPFDEVRPLICMPNKPDFTNFNNKEQNDVLGNFSVTLIDNLDTFVILGDLDKFKENVDLVIKTYKDFDINTNVQVFETNIRILGGLLSAHLYALDKFNETNYNGELLQLAYDIGKRLILAFDTETGLPYPRTNLSKGPMGVPNSLQNEQCSAGVVSPILEMTLLSRLTNDKIFETLTHRAFKNIWNRRSNLDLLPLSIDIDSNQFTDSITGIGASIDSLYEYALKYSILFNDDNYFQIWYKSYSSLLKHSMNPNGIFLNIDINAGTQIIEWIDSLSAFFPGLMVLGGDISNAIESHKIFWKLWNYYGCLPERWNTVGLSSDNFIQRYSSEYKKFKFGDVIPGFDKESTNEILVKNSISLEWYPLRPEFIESTYHLYKATKDPIYLQIGQEILYKLQKEFIAPCGFAGVLDILNNIRQDRMESFVLSETLKYLYLLFDHDNESINYPNRNILFSTEGHPLWYDRKLFKDYDFLKEDPIYDSYLKRKEEGQTHDEILLSLSNLPNGKDSIDSENNINDKTQDKPSFISGIINKFFKEYDKMNLDFKISALRNKIFKHLISYSESLIEVLSQREELGLTDDEKFRDYLSTRYSKHALEVLSGTNKVDTDWFSLESIQGYLNLLPSELHDNLVPGMVFVNDIYMNVSQNNYKKSLILNNKYNETVEFRLNKDYLNLETCENPLFNNNNNNNFFLHSKIMQSDSLYNIDQIHPLTLRRPMYRMYELEMELKSDFYENYVMYYNPQCRVIQETNDFEALIGDIGFSKDQIIYKIGNLINGTTDDEIYVHKDDLYIDELVGLRLRIERLKPGLWDSTGSIVVSDDNAIVEDSRILKLNGKAIDKDQFIYINSNSELLLTGNIGMDDQGFLVMDGSRVVNVKILDSK